MKCLICARYCVGQRDVRILQGQGPLHQACLRTLQFAKRQYLGLDLTAQKDEELAQLVALIENELASRNNRSHKPKTECYIRTTLQ
ncbi:MAG: hypothetical protein H7A09_02770 [Oceanospirillaceae bacterium]|nr:hypothetical protein [Oceanospirillaceae bacterium]